MLSHHQITVLFLGCLSLAFNPLEARGGGGGGHMGGGGGRGGGGFDRGGGGFDRGGGGFDRGGGGFDRGGEGFDRGEGDRGYGRGAEERNMDRGINRGENFSRTPSRDQVNQFLGGNAGRDFNRQNIDSAAQNFANRYPGIQRDAQQTANRVQNQLNNRYPGMNGWFNNNFFANHNFVPGYYNPGWNWWGPATWVGVAGWLAWNNTAAPLYYDDSGVANLAPQSQLPGNDDSIIYPSPSSQTTAPVSSTPQGPGDFLPLGVFAIAPNQTELPSATKFLQLALNKDGSIAGTFYNAATNETLPLTGAVDPNTQRAAWKMSDTQDSPIMSTGLYNLTEPATSATVHYPNGNEEVWQMVHVQQGS